MEDSAAAIVTGPAAAAPLKLGSVHQTPSSGGDASPGSGSFLMSDGKSPSPPPQQNDARSSPMHSFGGGSPLLHGKPLPPACFPLSLLYGQPSSYLFVGSTPLVPLPPPPPVPPPAPGPPHDLHTRGLLFPPLHGSFAPPFDPLSKFSDEAKPLPLCLLQERMAASCLELAVGRSAFGRRAAALEAALQSASRPYEQASKWRCDDPALLKLQSQPAFPESPKCSEASPCSDGPLSVVSPKWSAGQSASCPVCGATLAHASQMADHLQMEMDKLADFYSCRRWMIQEASSGDEECPATAERRPPYGPDKRSPLSRWETYLKVRGNRQQRLNAFCGRKMQQQQQQHRQRATLDALPLDLKAGPRHPESRVDDGTTLKVEVADGGNDPHEGGRSPSGQQRHPCGSPFSPVSPGAEDGAGGDPAASGGNASNGNASEKSGGSWPDEDGSRPSLRCGVCREPYCKPVVSVCCWHVHCERCWIQSLGSKGLCPQCETITCTSDLRKIHL
ncbi:E3 ubiquitin-protein ligase RNF220-like [Ornithodoros turicata]|uniref:E3 ubiquitin-protein ligase RNF220-like n=1 Tax=Ornithodoros turicata TaxID=34597 RepID=UPI0031395E8D